MFVWVLTGTLLAGSAAAWAQAPTYSLASIANTAANTAGPFAGNTFVSIYGENLSYATRVLAPSDMQAGQLPTVLSGTNVRVLLGLTPVNVYYASPRQVNILVPPGLPAGSYELVLSREGVAGPILNITLRSAAPGIFALGEQAVATHVDGSLIDALKPAQAGEVVILYASGLGLTLPVTPLNSLAERAAPLAALADFRVWLNDVALAPSAVLYAGVTPGFAGLYQINLRLPDDAGRDPEIRVGFQTGDRSPPGVRLIVR